MVRFGGDTDIVPRAAQVGGINKDRGQDTAVRVCCFCNLLQGPASAELELPHPRQDPPPARAPQAPHFPHFRHFHIFQCWQRQKAGRRARYELRIEPDSLEDPCKIGVKISQIGHPCTVQLIVAVMVLMAVLCLAFLWQDGPGLCYSIAFNVQTLWVVHATVAFDYGVFVA